MDTPKPTGDRVPFGDLTNTTHETDNKGDKIHIHSTYSNSATQLSDGNTTNEMDENSDWLHRQSNTIGYGYSPSPDNRLVTCPKERKRARDRARYAAMSTEQRAQKNKRRRELYATQKTPQNTENILEMTPEETTQPTDGVVPSSIGLHDDIDNNLIEMDIDTFQAMGMPFIERRLC